jgi:putative oxidoreductase
VLIAAVAAIVEAGPGTLSLDAALGKVKWGPGWALAALAAGVAGSAIAIERGRQAAEAANSESEPAA